MGDRGNIQVTHNEGGGTLFLYTHWSGSDIPAILAKALNNMEGRLDDRSYATRILFNTLQGSNRSTTGFGISLDNMDDNENDVPHIKWAGYGEPTITFNDTDYTPDEFVAAFGTRMTDEKFLESVRNS